MFEFLDRETLVRKPRRRITTNLQLESLEDRTTPAYLDWNGAVSTDWANAGNWELGGKPAKAAPGVGSDVRFGVVSWNNAPTVNTGVSADAGQIVVDTGFTANITVTGRLNVNAGLDFNSTYAIAGAGLIYFYNNSTSYLRDGTLSVAEVELDYGSQMALVDGFDNLTAWDITLGSHAGTGGRQNILTANTAGQTALSANVLVGDATVITVLANSELDFWTTPDTGSGLNGKGGFNNTGNASQTNGISIEGGKVMFKGVFTPSSYKYLEVDIPIVVHTGSLEVGESATLFSLNGATLSMSVNNHADNTPITDASDSALASTVIKVGAGSKIAASIALTHASNVYFYGRGQGGSVITANITGDLTFGNSGTDSTHVTLGSNDNGGNYGFMVLAVSGTTTLKDKVDMTQYASYSNPVSSKITSANLTIAASNTVDLTISRVNGGTASNAYYEAFAWTGTGPANALHLLYFGGNSVSPTSSSNSLGY